MGGGVLVSLAASRELTNRTKETSMTKQEHREKLYRLYQNLQCEEMADCRDWAAYKAAEEQYRIERNNYWLQHGEQWTHRDAEAMWVDKNRVSI
jgi:hypothetical protein